jgi:hypothetical protein
LAELYRVHQATQRRASLFELDRVLRRRIDVGLELCDRFGLAYRESSV